MVGIGLTLYVMRNRRDRLRDIERVYVEDVPDADETRPAMGVA